MNEFYQNGGSDLEFSFNWPDGAGGHADLTGWTAQAFEVDTEISPNVTVQLSDAATGQILVRVEWDNSYKTKRSYRFRVQIINGNDHRSTNLLEVIYQ